MLILGEKRKQLIKGLGNTNVYNFCYGSMELFEDFDFIPIESEKALESDVFDSVISDEITFLPLWEKSFYLYRLDLDKGLFGRYIFEENRIQYICKSIEGLFLLGIFHLWNLDEISDMELIKIARNAGVNAIDLIELLNNNKIFDYDIIEKNVYDYLIKV